MSIDPTMFGLIVEASRQTEAPASTIPPLPDSDLDDILALVDSVPDSEPASVTMELNDVRALVAECLAGRAKGAQPMTPAPLTFVDGMTTDGSPGVWYLHKPPGGVSVWRGPFSSRNEAAVSAHRMGDAPTAVPSTPMTDRYQAGYRAALAYVVEQLRYEASDKADAGAEITLRDFAESVAEWSADADPLVSARTATSAPAWERRGDKFAIVRLSDECTVSVTKIKGEWEGVAWLGSNPFPVGPYPTAPEAARAAVEALRAIVEPVVEQLSRVPDLEMP